MPLKSHCILLGRFAIDFETLILSVGAFFNITKFGEGYLVKFK